MNEKTETTEPDGGKSDGYAECPPLALCSVQIDGLRHALDALAALQSAQLCTRDDFASDCLQNAADEVRKAMRGMGA
ncbi:hypothetical protein [Sediminicoccus sp. KRV36]|uniref:hypothetical protein n=1 Tax=Sediminicoccus sp. KRV36 TaxID=3133721 RepID=UPI00200ECA62|nr:hypothetical protein [Sediminicoccus rosea]UPY35484.1 hypothetical protein LHU95_14795 [Sediminicoccus rosea]